MAETGHTVTLMRFGLATVLALLLGACQHPAAQTQPITTAPEMGLIRSTTQLDTPSGPTRRVEFKRATGGELVRLEFEHLTSGRLVLGQTSLRMDATGQWLLVNLGSTATTARFKPSTTALNEACKPTPLLPGITVLAAEFSANGVSWRANITRIYDLPKPLAGVSNESEPAVDLVACRFAGG